MTIEILRRLPRWGDFSAPWIAVVALFLASVTVTDGAAALVGITLAIAIAALCQAATADRDGGAPSGPRTGREPDQRLRGAYRRSFMPNGAGRPRRPRAPGFAATAA
ncbi:putative protein OS=Tsukamurella paurometabola (strain ATCC 8368 / DSM / CCUG 35730 /CIP 100753 / JCM 10117 / KCTC 9821 / NBRC 16120 / NCIMB 702349/ NCTC 13040) OX=521096 GN=Tpau_1909 PE=4 SV=1 [Tsukamurella paurometabola]|uniref:Uncharacterized protein n=1 Tax=Tsukamurella paurometabola (strain ATCC 8368 / DSM 20162 / CCUG 35730 / CIP 100753 / JCM 10117 / KCTC 9821 / NBRC 16120 / NCIMB 702349 / NCTC 13040) TaxID=521096 RepID=D5UN25_TSUPD|nr:DUF6412 domain-containing protein [Tsukamurella paurometabola]ADG78522.1 hypothetical protein Tpau_1909 [Tsukamurella paurometabola DSM 20162]SUP32024.1 Uncharacterised protein [Tsukamurella paurometabola]